MKVPRELKIKYLDRRIQDIENLVSSLDHDDFSLALKIGHQVKGNARTFDFPQMTQYGVEMENAAKIKDKEKLRRLVFKMQSLIQTAQQALN